MPNGWLGGKTFIKVVGRASGKPLVFGEVPYVRCKMTHESGRHLPTQVKLEFPAIFAIDECWEGNTIQQLLQPSYLSEVIVEEYGKRQTERYIITKTEGDDEPILAITHGAEPPEEFNKVLRVTPGSLVGKDVVPSNSSTWIRHPGLSNKPSTPINYKRRIEEAIKSWQGAFVYQREDRQKEIAGLRPPQIGAVHAVHAHWTVSDEPATVTMPTGTGKTETMLSILVSEQCPRLLVVVPTTPLRSQISNKFLTLGILKEIGVVTREAVYPIVGTLKHIPKSCDEVDYFFEKCNVIVTTMHIPGRCTGEVQERMAYHCPFLFIDEAHHVAARTWRTFKRRFASGRILQFTATPFRNDEKPIGGKIIFNYPLRKAQEEGYFRPINFEPVIEFTPSEVDRAIANRAIGQLIKDWQYGHILMARVETCKRAEKEVFPIYRDYKKLPAYQEYIERNPGKDLEFNPVQIHTNMAPKRRERVRQKILEREARVVVCVDMLGEGFDLPELKIAAFHDVKKSLPVTLQLAGRFTRLESDLGEPTFVANIADVDVRDELSKLYSQDADWNMLLRQSSEKAIQEQVNLWEFIEGFTDLPEDIPLQNVHPPKNVVIYRTKCEHWTPEEFSEGLRGAGSLERVYHAINLEKKVLVIVAARKVSIDWAQIEDIYELDWELYVAFWNDEQQLLFIASSNGKGYCRKLAKAIAGNNVDLVKAPHVFRCFYGVNRLRFYNVGLSRQLGRLVRYTMRAGTDVGAALTSAQMRNSLKSNLTGGGYENGDRVYIGCSRRGKIWSLGAMSLNELTEWCNHVGKKILDDSINFEQVLKGTLIPVTVSDRPAAMPIAIDWPEVIYSKPEYGYELTIGGEMTLSRYRTDISLKDPKEQGDLRFEICSDHTSAEFVLTLFERDGVKDYSFLPLGNRDVIIKQGDKEWAIEDFFYENPPVIWFSDGSSLEGNTFIELKEVPEPYPKAQIQEWVWNGIDITKESQGTAKRRDSIQYRVIENLKDGDYEIIYDDDDTGEAADVIAIRLEEKQIVIEFYHCKFAHRSKKDKKAASARIEDLYAVCGQAQKSIHWKRKPTELFKHLLRREPRRRDGQEVSRFERGGRNDVKKAMEMSTIYPTNLKIFIVQPGLSKAQVSIDQLQLLGVTQNYLMETYELPFGVIASP
jgi:superfamily II DNA or RNA helicase